MFLNSTGRRLLLETWISRGPDGASTHMTRVAINAAVSLPESVTAEWIVYLADTFTRIGKFRLDPAADGKRAWAEFHIDRREYDVAYVPENSDQDAFYVAWHCPQPARPRSDHSVV